VDKLAWYWQVVVGVTIAVVSATCGALISRHFQRRGKIIVRVDKWFLTFQKREPVYGSMATTEYSDASQARCHLDISLWSEKEVKTALHGIKVVFRKGKDTLFESQPLEEQAIFSQVNLPSREWVPAHLRFWIYKSDLAKLPDCNNVVFVGRTPENREVCQPIVDSFHIGTAHMSDERAQKIQRIINDKKLESSSPAPQGIKEVLDIIHPGENFTLAEIKEELERME
jgi:hypothetical protein